jgi:hypothetical protein
VNPQWFHCGSESSFYLNADPDPDPGSKTNADPDPGRTSWHKKLNLKRYGKR